MIHDSDAISNYQKIILISQPPLDSETDLLGNVNIDVSSRSGSVEDEEDSLGAVSEEVSDDDHLNNHPFPEEYMEMCFADPLEPIPPLLPPLHFHIIEVENINGEEEGEGEPPDAFDHSNPPNCYKRKYG